MSPEIHSDNSVDVHPDHVLKDLEDRGKKAKWGRQFVPCKHPDKQIAMF